MTVLPWTLRRRRPKPPIEVLTAERDALQAKYDALLQAHQDAVAENRRLRLKGQLSESDELRDLRRQADQDRRNAVVISDALAFAEYRSAHGSMLDEPAAKKLFTAVRSTVFAFINTLPPERPW